MPDLEGRLKAERPEPTRDLVRAIEERIGADRAGTRRSWGSRTGRLVFALVLTAAAVAALAGFGSLSYAASKASTGASSAVKMVKVSVGLKKSAPAAKAKPSANAAKAKRSATRRKCADDADRPSEVQYEEEDDNFNDPEECSKKGDD